MKEVDIKPQDLEIISTRGSGPGGQHRNKVETAIQIKHLPTGIVVKAESEKSQQRNKESALQLLAYKLTESAVRRFDFDKNRSRIAQIGAGQRGDKRRTVRLDGVIDHLTGQRWRYDDYIKGNW